ncbi:MAG: cyclic nucleotide-binding domain-containing protein, partial [Candidatus Promineifilaceae bacterium]
MAHFLKNVALFANLSDEDLDRLCDMMERVELAAGEVLFQQDEPGDRCFVIESGELEILQSAGGRRQVQLALRRQGEVIGEMALLEERPRSATVRARSPSVLLTLNRAQFNELLETSPSAARAMFQIVLQRLRSSQAALMQSERLAQLGQLTAGLTHELNNPASAVRRGTNQLEQVVLDFAQGYREQSRLEFDAQQTAVCERLSTLARQRAQNPPEMDTLLRSDREAELEEWLERHMVERAWELAPGLVNLNLRPAELDELADLFDTDALEVILRWLVAVYMTFNLFAEIGEGAARISSLVDALKQYVYLDQAPMQAVDIQQGLDKT